MMKTNRWRRVLAAGAVVTLFVMSSCSESRSQEEPSSKSAGESEKIGVIMQMEQSTYFTDVKEIPVSWINGSNVTLTFGESWSLEKQNGEKWEPVNESGQDVAFRLIGYPVKPGEIRQHTYHPSTYASRLEVGRYRIVTSCSEGQGDSLQKYMLTAEFDVTEDENA